MPILFDDDEEAYLAWVAANPEGYVVNLDRRRQMPGYPMIHSAAHGLLSSVKIGNFTTGDYVKICGKNWRDLETHCRQEIGRKPVMCRSRKCRTAFK